MQTDYMKYQGLDYFLKKIMCILSLAQPSGQQLGISETANSTPNTPLTHYRTLKVSLPSFCLNFLIIRYICLK